MNPQFNTALRQSAAVRKELDALADSPNSSPAIQGQLNASLTSFSRTIDDYNRLAKQELNTSKQEKAFERVKTFRAELADYREQFDRLKRQADDRQDGQNRGELLGRRPHQASTPENPYGYSNASSSAMYGGRPGAPPGQNPYSLPMGTAPGDMSRETHAFREQSFFQNTSAQLDEFLDRGRQVLGDLGQQKEVMKETQRRLYSVANTLGISGDTIRMVERRATQDKWIFWGGVIVFFVFCYLVLRYLR